MYLDRRFGLNLSLSEITLLFGLSLYLDRTLAQRKAQRKAKSKVKVAHCTFQSQGFVPTSQTLGSAPGPGWGSAVGDFHPQARWMRTPTLQNVNVLMGHVDHDMCLLTN